MRRRRSARAQQADYNAISQEWQAQVDEERTKQRIAAATRARIAKRLRALWKQEEAWRSAITVVIKPRTKGG